jgi:NAD-dependent dihydropyrimidine dehydrogenase PreA subunit
MSFAGAKLPQSATIIVTAEKTPKAILGELFDAPTQADETHLARARDALGALHSRGEPHWRPWFPVIDYDRCSACGQCEAFCLFGVYDVADQIVRVARPANCKNNCPACARVCPQQAIIFPKHDAAPINANDATAPQADVMPGFGDLRDPDVMEKLRARADAARAAAERKRTSREGK